MASKKKKPKTWHTEHIFAEKNHDSRQSKIGNEKTLSLNLLLQQFDHSLSTLASPISTVLRFAVHYGEVSPIYVKAFMCMQYTIQH